MSQDHFPSLLPLHFPLSLVFLFPFRRRGEVRMNVIPLPVQHTLQVQRPVAMQKEVTSSHLLSSQSSVLSPQSSLLVGREAELTHLSRLLDKALKGERQIVFVTGEAGMG